LQVKGTPAGLELLLSCNKAQGEKKLLLCCNKAQGEKNLASFQLEVQIIADRIHMCKEKTGEEKEGRNPREK